MENTEANLYELFKELPDPRKAKGRRHSLEDVPLITTLAVICGADDWSSVEGYVRAQQAFLSGFVEIRQSHRGTTELLPKNENTGKVDGKSNEITAIPKLLGMLDLSELVVTIDGIDCQRNIAQQIIEQQGDFILMVKGNQAELLDEIKALMETLPPDSEDLQQNTAHDRNETRRCKVVRQMDWLDGPEKWRGLSTIIRVEATRKVKSTTSTETRYYISCLKTGANTFNYAVRKHWDMENSLHWVLDWPSGRMNAGSRRRTPHKISP